MTRPDPGSQRTPPQYKSLVVNRHARIALAGDQDHPTEAWLVLHGHGMLAQGILHWFRHALRPGRLLVAPEALSRFYTHVAGARAVGGSWMTREDRANEIFDIMAYLDRVAEECLDGIARVEVHGFSQGVAAAARWTAHTSRDVARLVCWAGSFPEDVSGPALKRRLGDEPVHMVIGDHDKHVSPEQVASGAARLRAEGLDVVVHEFAGGHRVDERVLKAL